MRTRKVIPVLAALAFLSTGCSASGQTAPAKDAKPADAQIPTYADGYRFGQELLKDTYHGDGEAASEEAFDVCQEGQKYETDQLYTVHGIGQPVDGTNIEIDRAHNALTKALGQSPTDALMPYNHGCMAGIWDRMSLASIFDKAGPLLGDPYKDGRRYAHRWLKLVTRPDKELAVRSVCRIESLNAMNVSPDEWGEGDAGVADAWSRTQSSKANKEFIKGCDEVASR
ncbi:hypothetical protein ACFYPK_32050 [Streptomyces halstedii]|uniref:hypothetical protein n=1 Tax=Streptomyces halstedii TaxID=1944 RepID=UPI00345F2AD1